MREDGQYPELDPVQKKRLYETYIYEANSTVFWRPPWGNVDGSLEDVQAQNGTQKKVQLSWMWKHHDKFPEEIKSIKEHNPETELKLPVFLANFTENGNGEDAKPYLDLPQDESLNKYFVDTPNDSKTWVQWWTILSRAVDMTKIFTVIADKRKLDQRQLKSEIEKLSNVTELISLQDFETYESAVAERTRIIQNKVLTFDHRPEPKTIPSIARKVR